MDVTAILRAELRNPRTRKQRVLALAHLLQSGNASRRPDGGLLLQLPAEAEALFVEDRSQRKKAWRAAIKRARIALRASDAELADIKQQDEANEEALALLYAQLRREGHSHQEAFRRLMGGKPGRRIPPGLATCIRRGMARLRRSGVLPGLPEGAGTERRGSSYHEGYPR